eukprot:EG_transcript_5493
MATHVAKNIFPELATPYEVAGREFDAEIEVASASSSASNWWQRSLPVGATLAACGAVAISLLRHRRAAGPRWAMCATDEEEVDPTVVLVSNLPDNATGRSLGQHFAFAGQVVSSTIQTEPDETGTTVRRGTVKFASWDGAAHAVQSAKDHPMGGNVLEVEPDDRPASLRNKRRFTRDAKDPSADGSEKDKQKAKEAEKMMEKWEALREKKDFTGADKVRDDMQEKGIFINVRTRTWSLASLQSDQTAKSVIVDGIPPSAVYATLKQHFEQIGKVEFLAIFKDKTTGKQSSRGVVRFVDLESAKTAIAQSGQESFEFEGAKLSIRVDRLPPPAKKPPTTVPERFAWTQDKNTSADEKVAAEVAKLLNERELARLAKDFTKADALRTEILSKGVSMNEKTRTWSLSTQVDEEEATVVVANLVPPNARWEDVRQYFSAIGTVEYIGLPTDPESKLPVGRATVRYATPAEAQKAVDILPNIPFLGVNLNFRLSRRLPPKPKAKAAAKN